MKKSTIYGLGLLGACLLVVGYFRLKDRQVKADAAKKTEALLTEGIAQNNGLEKLGDIDLSPSGLSLEKLEEKLHQPGLELPGARNTTKLGWACGAKECAIWASFLVPFGQEIPATLTPAVLLVSAPLFKYPHHLAIGGIYLGEPS